MAEEAGSVAEKRPAVLVVGDVILDRYRLLRAERISPEAPAIVYRDAGSRHALGGAAAVALMCQRLGADVRLVGLTGRDPDGSIVRHLLAESPLVSDVAAVRERPTTVKERLCGDAGHGPQQLLRIDRQTTAPPPPDIRAELTARCLEEVPRVGAILFADYRFGACWPELCARVLEAARARELPVLVDPPRGDEWFHYAGATLIKPNRYEARSFARLPVESPADALEAARSIARSLSTAFCVVTLDRDGAVLAGSDVAITAPAPPAATRVVDVTGCGDQFLAALGVSFASGLAPALAFRLANAAAGLQALRPGIVPITSDELAESLTGVPLTAPGRA